MQGSWSPLYESICSCKILNAIWNISLSSSDGFKQWGNVLKAEFIKEEKE
jgi:hypothetical protein